MNPNYYAYAVYIAGRCYLVTDTIKNAIALTQKYRECPARISRTHHIYRTGTPRHSGPVTIWERTLFPEVFRVLA